jgi:asparagine synthase (glutamine-hydrolysing)
MCGIAGIVYDNLAPEAVRLSVRRMIALQRHRGPDGEGFYDTVGASLGHCRLAIIDLTDAGHQPMCDREGRFWITFNGEIYNYLELAEELGGLGHRFRGQSDTEVLLAAFREWREACLDRLRGMFAFSIWDEKDQYLFAARDRLGIKPFHYWTDEKTCFAFASELKALLEFLPQRHVNLRLAREFLAWELLDHEPCETMIAGIKRLPPACAMTWRRREGLRSWRYWHLEINNDLEGTTPEGNRLIKEFPDRLKEVVSLHLRSDLPVGTCLSGGLDSSAIACMVSAELRRRGAWKDNWQHTFSACFEDSQIDERPYIETVIAATGCQSHYVFPDGDRLAEDLDSLLWHQEEPFGDTGIYAQYCVARLAAETGIKVVLDGQGADEQLAGYRKFILVYLMQLIKAGQYIRASNEAAAFFFSPDILRTSWWAQGRRYLSSSLPKIADLWPNHIAMQRPEGLGIGASLARRIELDMARYSLPVLLRYEDRNMMAFGVESRVPFVDHIFVEWLAKLPCNLRLSAGWSKRILREAFKGILPEPIRLRRSKLGFVTPRPAWISGPLSDWQTTMLTSPRHLSEVVDMASVAKLFARYTGGERSLAVQDILFRLAIYEAWARRILEISGGERSSMRLTEYSAISVAQAPQSTWPIEPN